MEYGIYTHVGAVRDKNEDKVFLRLATHSHYHTIALAIVADGMGGMSAGDRASALAVECLKNWWDQKLSKILEKENLVSHLIEELYDQFFFINNQIIQMQQRLGKKMGTTLSVLFLLDYQYIILHVGDSRIYRITSNKKCNSHTKKIYRLTEDHTWVWQQVVRGHLLLEEAKEHPKSNILLQCLGVNDGLNPFIKRGSFEEEDCFLLCTDGLHNYFVDREFIEILSIHQHHRCTLQEVSEFLVQSAIKRGGRDNLSVLFIKKANGENS